MLKPLEFEELVGNYYTSHGYQVEKTPINYDYGVDLFATKGKEKIAVQAKLYDQRQVNHEVVMVLYAAKALYDCTEAVIITTGKSTPQASEVAKKLGITLLMEWSYTPESMIPDKTDANEADTLFELIWGQHIMHLKGNTLTRSNEKQNQIADVNWECLIRVTSNGKSQRLPIEIFRKVVNHLAFNGEIERDAINQLYTRRASSGICLILSQSPYIELIEKPKIKLVLDKASALRDLTLTK